MTTLSFEASVADYLRSAPNRRGLTGRELVRQTLALARPDTVPFSSVIPLGGDFCEVRILERLRVLAAGPSRSAGEHYMDEWGVKLEVTGREWDHAVGSPLSDLDCLPAYVFPRNDPAERYAWALPYLRRAAAAGKFLVGRDPIMMAERLRLLAGFETMMIAHHTHLDALRKLVTTLTDMTVEVVEYWAELGCMDAFMTIQDWGLQDRLQIAPAVFREFYLPHYRRVAEVCHTHGLKYFWHCCGWIVDIIPDMIAIGVDAVQLDQPRLMGHQRLADEFGGRIAFWNAVDIQWLTQPGATRSEAELRAEVRWMVAPFQRFGGGLILRQYIAPESLQISPSVMEILCQAFVEYR